MSTKKQKSTLQHVFFTEEEGYDFRLLVAKILSHWKIIVASIIVFLSISFAASFFVNTQFKIRSSILVKENNKNEKDFLKELNYFETPTSIENEIEILHSYSLVREVVDSLKSNIIYHVINGVTKQYIGTASSPIILEIIRNDSVYESFSLNIELISAESYKVTNKSIGEVELVKNIFQFGDEVDLGDTKFVVLKSESFEQYLGAEMSVQVINPRQYTISLIDEIKIQPVSPQSNVIEIVLETPHKNRGIEIIDLLVKKYAQRELLIKNKKGIKLVNFIDGRLVNVGRTLQGLESEFEDYRKGHKILTINQEGNTLQNNLNLLETQRAKSELNLEYYVYLINYLENPKLDELLSPSTVGITDPVLNDLITKLNGITYQLVQLKASTSTINPQYKTLQSLYFSIVSSIKENVVNLKNATTLEIDDLKDRILIAENQFKQLPSSDKYLVSIQRNLKLSESLYLYLQEQKAEAEIALANNESSVQVIDNAIPVSQARPKLMLNLSIGLFLGLVFPVFLIVAFDFLKRGIFDLEDIYNVSTIPVISTIPVQPCHFAKGKSVNIKEQFKKLCSFLIMLDIDSIGGKSILFTSVTSGAGKTFCSHNTAISFAKAGYKTLLIDLDFQNAKLSEMLSGAGQLGITDILFGGVHWQELAKPTIQDSLSFLGKGSFPYSSDLMIPHNVFGEFLLSAKAEFDFVIIDASSLSIQPDLLLVAHHVDSNIVVLRRKESTVDDVRQMSKLVESKALKNISFVYNFSTSV